MLIAQNLAERGMLDSLASSMQRSSDTLGTWFSSVSPTTWAVAGVVVCLVLLFWSRR